VDVGAIAGTATSLVTALGALLGASLQNRREARVRASIASNLTMIKELEATQFPITKELTGELETTMRSDFEALSRLVTARNQVRERNRPSLYVGLFMAAVLTTPLWFLWKPTEVWAWALFLGLAFVAGLFVILGVMAWSAGPPGGAEQEGGTGVHHRELTQTGWRKCCLSLTSDTLGRCWVETPANTPNVRAYVAGSRQPPSSRLPKRARSRYIDEPHGTAGCLSLD
jgi:hypothetical protein